MDSGLRLYRSIRIFFVGLRNQFRQRKDQKVGHFTRVLLFFFRPHHRTHQGAVVAVAERKADVSYVENSFDVFSFVFSYSSSLC